MSEKREKRGFNGALADMAIGLNSLIALLIIIGVSGVLAAATGEAASRSLGASIFVALGCLVIAIVICGIVAILGDIRSQLLLLNSKVDVGAPKEGGSA